MTDYTKALLIESVKPDSLGIDILFAHAAVVARALRFLWPVSLPFEKLVLKAERLRADQNRRA